MPISRKEELLTFLRGEREMLADIIEANAGNFDDPDVAEEAIRATVALCSIEIKKKDLAKCLGLTIGQLGHILHYTGKSFAQAKRQEACKKAIQLLRSIDAE